MKKISELGFWCGGGCRLCNFFLLASKTIIRQPLNVRIIKIEKLGVVSLSGVFFSYPTINNPSVDVLKLM